MITTHNHKGLVWLDAQSPTVEEIANLVKRYDLHPLVGEELRDSSSMAKIDFYKDYILVVLTLPARIHKDAGHAIRNREIDFVVGKNFLITSREDTIEQIEYFAKIFDTNAILNKDEKIEHAGHLFYYMIKRIYSGMINDLENIKDAVTTAENHIFSGDEKAMVEVLSKINRELIDFKQTARIHHDVWKEMGESTEKDMFGKDFISYIHDIRADFEKIHEVIENSRELLNDLRSTNNSLLNAKQNEVMKVLTLVAFVFYPLNLIANIFIIPGPAVPLTHSPQGWNIIVTSLIVLGIAIIWFFRKKKWL